MKTSNYDITRDKMEAEFIKYDQTEMIKKFDLRHDEDYLYINFVSREYRICRRSGRVEHVSPNGEVIHADFNVSMTIFDVLAYSKPGCCLSGQFASINNLKSTAKVASSPASDMFAWTNDFFAGKCSQLKNACIALGGIEQAVGDVSYKLPLFDFIPIILQFWDADDEFPSSFNLKWDENILDYMHYETTFYAVSHLFERLKTLCGYEKHVR